MAVYGRDKWGQLSSTPALITGTATSTTAGPKVAATGSVPIVGAVASKTAGFGTAATGSAQLAPGNVASKTPGFASAATGAAGSAGAVVSRTVGFQVAASGNAGITGTATSTLSGFRSLASNATPGGYFFATLAFYGPTPAQPAAQVQSQTAGFAIAASGSASGPAGTVVSSPAGFACAASGTALDPAGTATSRVLGLQCAAAGSAVNPPGAVNSTTGLVNCTGYGAAFTPPYRATLKTAGFECAATGSVASVAAVKTAGFQARAVGYTDIPLPGGRVKFPYYYTLTDDNVAVAPFTYTVTSGALPTGVTISPTTGKLTGVPKTAGKFSARIRVTDAASNTSERQYSVTVIPQYPDFVAISGTGGTNDKAVWTPRGKLTY